MTSQRIEKLLETMTPRQKVGQMLVFGFSDTYPHRDILEMIDTYHVAGFRVTPRGRKFRRYFGKDHPANDRVSRKPEPNERVYTTGRGSATPVTIPQYAEVLNVLRRKSLETGAGIPVYFALDFEGNFSADLLGPGMYGFPQPMGLVASGDPKLCRQVGKTIGAQLKAAGIDWIHSPVLDVNTNPANPEIGTRSYSPFPETVSQYALETLRGFTEANLISAAKHFPGRGHSAEDVHFGIAVIEETLERMHDVHLAPYKALIAAGLPSIMLAHSVFPALDSEKEIATLSKAVITDLLKEELGFGGVVMTDSFTMGGLVAKYEVSEAGVKCVQNGVDLILLKDENSLRREMFDGLLAAVEKNEISQDRLNDAVGRVLSVKERFGLLDEPHGLTRRAKLDAVLKDPAHAETAAVAAQKSIVVLRDEKNNIPIKPGTRVLVVEQTFDAGWFEGRSTLYPGALYHALLERGVDAFYTDYDRDMFEEAWPVIQERAEHADMIVYTGYYKRGSNPRKENFDRFMSLDLPSVFVTNSPYPEVVSADMPSVLVTFSGFVKSMHAAADILTGRTSPTAQLAFDPTVVY